MLSRRGAFHQIFSWIISLYSDRARSESNTKDKPEKVFTTQLWTARRSGNFSTPSNRMKTFASSISILIDLNANSFDYNNLLLGFPLISVRRINYISGRSWKTFCTRGKQASKRPKSSVKWWAARFLAHSPHSAEV
jgi:hypothetical protein